MIIIIATICQVSALCQVCCPSGDGWGRFYYPDVTDKETEALRQARAWSSATWPGANKSSKSDLPDGGSRPFPLHGGPTLTGLRVLRGQFTSVVSFCQHDQVEMEMLGPHDRRGS